MDSKREKKKQILEQVKLRIKALNKKTIGEKLLKIEERLFDFANFREAKLALFYPNVQSPPNIIGILKRCLDTNKKIALPIFEADGKIKILKVDKFKKKLSLSKDKIPAPDPEFCKIVPIDTVEIAIIPGFAFDHKGGRIGFGIRQYDKLIAALPVTTRKIGVVFHEQVVNQIPQDLSNKNIDIIVTDKKIIYKI